MALVALGVGGGIGAYKAVEVARGLQKNGHDVVAVLTRNARRFITPLTFEAITRRRVLINQYEPGVNTDIEHIAVANDIALLLVAPATANIIAKFAHGLADDYLSTLFLATPAPVLLAPAMNTRMLEHPAVQENARILAERGVRFVDPPARQIAGADLVVMAAAVADYAPEGGALESKKTKADASWSLPLTRTRDILADLGASRRDGRPLLVGFAAQTGDPVPAAQKKLAAKGADLIVANDVSRPGSGFDVDTNEVTLVDAGGAEPLPLMTKDAVAAAILDRVARMLAAKIVAQ